MYIQIKYSWYIGAENPRILFLLCVCVSALIIVLDFLKSRFFRGSIVPKFAQSDCKNVACSASWLAECKKQVHKLTWEIGKQKAIVLIPIYYNLRRFNAILTVDPDKTL